MLNIIENEKVLAKIIFERDAMIEAMSKQIDDQRQEIERLKAEKTEKPCQEKA